MSISTLNADQLKQIKKDEELGHLSTLTLCCVQSKVFLTNHEGQPRQDKLKICQCIAIKHVPQNTQGAESVKQYVK